MSFDDFFVRESSLRNVVTSVGRHVILRVTEHVHPCDAWLVAIESRTTNEIVDIADVTDITGVADSGNPVCVWVD